MQARKGDEPWWVRVRHSDGAVLGAGVLLDARRVLTCAHVIPDPGGEVVVEFVGLPGVRAGVARVAEGRWVPPDENDQRGDLALLDLAEPVPPGYAAVLLRPKLWKRRVYTRGFPDHLDDGLWVEARLLGRGGPGGEWIQMDAKPDREIRRGFSGAPVIDDHTGGILGIVVSEFPGLAGLAWMIPVETILRYLPEVTARVADAPSMADRIEDFFGPGGSGGAMVVVSGDEPVSTSLHESAPNGSGHVSHHAERQMEHHAEHVEDVSGMTVAEVHRRVDDALERTQGEQLFIFDAVDAADDPGKLATEVIRPLSEDGHRVIAGLRQESAELRRILDRPSVSRRLELLDILVAKATSEARAAREEHRRIARLVTPMPAWPEGAPALRLRVAHLRRQPQPAPAELEDCERQAEELLREAFDIRLELDRLRKAHGRLRGLLESYHSGPGTARSELDPVLAEMYAQAHELLYGRPCDLSTAAEAVDRYVHVLRDGR